MSKSGFCEDRKEIDPLVACISVDSLHSEWIKQTEIKLNGVLEGTLNFIRNMKLPSKDFAEFVEYLQADLDKEIEGTSPPASVAGSVSIVSIRKYPIPMNT